jgi:FkbM family methyltransferase
MISAKTLLDSILRLPFSLIPHEAVVRILRGPLRGMKWVKGAGPNAYWVGTYEVARVSAFARAVNQGAVVYDVGANVGIYSLVASSRVGGSGRIYAFEPLDRNLRYLHRHIMLNDIQNCTVVEKAVCNEEGTLPFAEAAWEPSMTRLSSDGEILVHSTTLDSCIYGELRFRAPDIIKIDVEGAELEVLKGATRTIIEFYPTIFLEIHGTQLHADCRDFLLAKGYSIEEAYAQLTATRRPAADQR